MTEGKIHPSDGWGKEEKQVKAQVADIDWDGKFA